MSRRGLMALLVLLGVLLRFWGEADAGVIAVDLVVAAEVTPEAVSVEVRVSSGGDETARRVSPEITLAGATVQLEETGELPPGASREWAHTFSRTAAGLRLPGFYPVLVRLRYHDANLYPFSRAEVYMVSLGSAPNPPAYQTELAPAGPDAFAVRLRNTGDQPFGLRFSPFFPQELEGSLDTEAVTLAPGEKRELRLAVRKRGALAGNRYTLFLLGEIKEGGGHYGFALFTPYQVPGEAREGGWGLAAVSLATIVLLFLLVAGWELRRHGGGDGTS